MYRLVALASRHWKPLLILNAVVACLTAIGIGTTPPFWLARAKLVAPQSTQRPLHDPAAREDAAESDDGNSGNSVQAVTLNTLSAIATSSDTLDAVRRRDVERDEFAASEEGYRELFTVSARAESTVIDVAVQGASPEVALERTQLLLDAFFAETDRLRQQHAQDSLRALDAELEQSEASLKEAQLNLADFQSASNPIVSDQRVREIRSSIAELTSTRAETIANARASERRSRELSTSLGLTVSQATRLLTSDTDSTVRSLQARIAEIDTSLAQIDDRFLTDSLTARALKQERNRLLERLNESLPDESDADDRNLLARDNTELLQAFVLANSEAVAQQQRADALQQEIDVLKDTIGAVPATQARLQELRQAVERSQRIYDGLSAQIEATKLNAIAAYPIVQVLEQPNVGPHRAGPSRKMMAMGGVLAAALGSGVLVLLLESRNPLLAPRDLQTVNIPVLETVPRLNLLLGHQQLPLLRSAPEFQWLASDVESFALAHKFIMVTSANAGEGKTSTVLGLAMALANLGMRVLLVDGDFHTGALSQQLGFMWTDLDRLNSSNLADLDVTPMSIEPGLDLLPSHPIDRDLTRFVAQGKFADYLQRAAATGDYDYVLVDGAPIGLTSDAVLMAREVENVLMVVRPGTSNLYPFRNAIAQLQRYGTTILGIVVNGRMASATDYLYGRQLPENVPT